MGVAIPSRVPGPGSMVSKLRLFLFKRAELRIVFPGERSFPTGMRSVFLSRLQNTEEEALFFFASAVSTIN